jgi:hypothetical protein
MSGHHLTTTRTSSLIRAIRRSAVVFLGGAVMVAVSATFGVTSSRASGPGHPAGSGEYLPLPAIGWSQANGLPAGFVSRWNTSYAYYPAGDAGHGQVVLFGGAPKDLGESWHNDTWLYSNSTGLWTQGPAAPGGLTPRDGAAMAYDPVSQKIVLFGGANGTTWPPSNQTWLYNGSTWTAGPTAPAALQGRIGAEMVYDPDIGKIVMVGGSGAGVYTDTWLYNGATNAWTQGPNTPGSMQPRAFFGITYDPVLHKVLVAGGDGTTDSWYFDGTSWTAGPSFEPIGAKELFSMAYDTDLGGILTFSGTGPNSPSTALSLLKGGAWTDVPSTGAPWPSGRASAPAVWNTGMDAWMTIGGIDSGDAGTIGLSDAWYFRDTPPQVSSAKLTPAGPDASTTIKLSAGATVGGYKSWTNTYRWFVNGVPVTAATGTKLTPVVGKFKHGDVVSAQIQVVDALGIVGPWVWPQTNLTVADRLPSIRTVTLTPSTAYVTSTLTATANNVTDPDGDVVSFHYAWTVNDQPVTGIDSPNLPPGQFTSGDSVAVSVTPVDSFGASGSPVSSDPKVGSWDVLVGSTGSPGGNVTGVHGGGFAANETIDIKLDSPTGPALATVVADAGGEFPGGPVTLPSPLTGGLHTFYAVGRTSAIAGPGPVTVVPGATLNPTGVAAGDVASVVGAGFRPNEMVSASFPGGPTSSGAANASGSVTLAVTSPAEPAGGGTLTASAPSGTATDNYSTVAKFVGPDTAEPGDQAPITLTGYQAGETINATFDGGQIRQSYQANALGSVSSTLLLDTTWGGHDITMTGVSSGIAKTDHVTLPIMMTVSPVSGPIGTVVTVKSMYGWTPGEQLNLYWGSNVQQALVADPGGSAQTTFTIPTHVVGDETMKVKDEATSQTASTTFTVTGGNNLPPTIGSATISGKAYVNQVFTAVAHDVSDPNGDLVTLHYAWTVNGSAAGSDSSAFSSATLVGGDVVAVTISTVDSHGLWGGTASASITAAWNVTTNGSGVPGGKVGGVGGNGLGASETVDVRLDSLTGTILMTGTTDANGKLPSASVTLPTPLSGGVHKLFAIGHTTGIVGPGVVTVLADGSISPAAVSAGDITTFTGVGFLPGETVSVTFPGGAPATKAASSSGSVTIPIASPPEPAGGGVVTASAPSGTVTDTFTTVAAFYAPAAAEPGDNVLVTLTGFGASESVNAKFDSGATTQVFTTDAKGSVSSYLLLDTTFGTHDITMTGATSGVTKVVNRVSMPAWMTVTPSSGPVGTVVTVRSAFGWIPGETVHLYWGATVVKDVVADGSGTVSTTYTIPTHGLGAVTMKLKDDVMATSTTATYTVT